MAIAGAEDAVQVAVLQAANLGESGISAGVLARANDLMLGRSGRRHKQEGGHGPHMCMGGVIGLLPSVW